MGILGLDEGTDSIDVVLPRKAKLETVEDLEKTLPRTKSEAVNIGVVMPRNAAKMTPAQEWRTEAMAKPPIAAPYASALRGATFGLSDKAIAYAQHLLKDPKEFNNYNAYLRELQDQRDAFGTDHPYLSLGSEISGALSTGGPVSKLVDKGVTYLAPGYAKLLTSKGIVPAIARAGNTAAGGALAGAVSGAGQSESGNELQGAKNGAEIGALTALGLKGAGGAASAIGNVVSPYIKRAGAAMGMVDPQKWAQNEWLTSLGLDGDTIKSFAAKVNSLAGRTPTTESSASLPVMAMDAAGLNAKSKLKAAAQTSTPARAELDKVLNQRNLGQTERLEDLVRTSVSPQINASTAAQDIYQNGRTLADPLYQAARDIGQVNDPAVTSWFNSSKNRQRVLLDYAKAQADNGTPLSAKMTVHPKGEFTWSQAPTVEDLMRIKDYYGSLRNSLWDDTLGRPSSKERVTINGNKYGYDQISDEYRSIRDLLRKVTPDGKTGGSLLAQADAISGDAAEVGKALQAGKGIRSYSAEDLKNAWKGLESDAEREAFRIGAASELYAGVDKAKSGPQAVYNLYGSKAMKDKMNTIFPNNSAQDYFDRVAAGEAAMADTARQLGPKVSAAAGSIVAEAPDSALGGMVAHGMRGNPAGFMNALGRFLGNQWEGNSPKFSEPLLRLGMQSPEEVAALAAKLGDNGGVGSKVAGALSAIGDSAQRGAPYAGANVAGQQTPYPTFDAWLDSNNR